MSCKVRCSLKRIDRIDNKIMDVRCEDDNDDDDAFRGVGTGRYALGTE